MNIQLKNLLRDIERLKKELNELGKVKKLTDPEVVQLSQKLDVLLNEYERLKKSNS